MLRTSLRSLAQHRLRLALTVVAVVAGVGFVTGTYLFTDSLQRAFDRLFDLRQPDVTVSRQLPGQAATGGAAGGAERTLPAALVDRIAKVPGVAAAYGVVTDGSATVMTAGGEPLARLGQRTTGTSWVPNPRLRGYDLVSGRAPIGRGEVALLASTAARAGVTVGGTVRVDTPGGVIEPTVVGLVERPIAGTDGGTLVVFDLPTARRLLLEGRAQVTSVVVAAAPGIDQQRLADRITDVLPPDARAETGRSRSADLAARLQDAFTFLSTFLLAFAGIALLVAGFLIYNTFTMLVAARTRELALLRAVGASRGQVRRAVLVEAAAVGTVAAGLGLVAGIGVSGLLRRLFEAFGVDLPGGPLVVEPRTIAVALVVGVVTTVASAYLPARRAALVPPVAAMREELELPARSLRGRTLLALLLVVAAVVLARTGLQLVDDVERAAAYLGGSAVCALVALLAGAPLVGRGALRVLGAPLTRWPVGRLARENARRNPRRTAATAAALAIGLAVMSAVAVIAASTKSSVAEVVDDTVGADFIVASANLRPFTPRAYEALAGTPGTSVVTFSRAVALTLDGTQHPVIGVEPEQFAKVFKITMAQGSFADLAFGGAVVDETTAREAHLQLGQTAHVEFLNGPGRLRIDGIYQASGAAQGFVVTLPTLAAAGSLERDTAIYVRLAPGADAATVRTALEQRLAPVGAFQVLDRTELKEQIDAQFDRVFGFVYALLALAVIVAFLGIVNTLALSVHERRREIGLLRAVGTSRHQLRVMVVLESVLVAVLGGVVGILLGVLYGALLQRVLAAQGVSTLSVPVAQLGWFVAVSAAGGLLAALWPAMTAARMNLLRAIATE